MSQLAKKTRGEQRFGGLTYTQISEWTGLNRDTVRNYRHAGQFDPQDVIDTLCWVNSRRKRLGLPLLGIPRPDPEPIEPDEYAHNAPIPIQTPYNPLRGEFDG